MNTTTVTLVDGVVTVVEIRHPFGKKWIHMKHVLNRKEKRITYYTEGVEVASGDLEFAIEELGG